VVIIFIFLTVSEGSGKNSASDDVIQQELAQAHGIAKELIQVPLTELRKSSIAGCEDGVGTLSFEDLLERLVARSYQRKELTQIQSLSKIEEIRQRLWRSFE